jgi:RNA polymerase sigma factor (sigma-70 family)
MPGSPAPDRSFGAPPDSSLALLQRAKAGDRLALETLLERYRPRLRRWARRRLPNWARDLTDTDDLVQDTLLNTLRNLDAFAIERDGGFQNYIRLAVGNAIRDEIRRVRRRPGIDGLDPEIPSDELSPLERAVNRERLSRYESALATLPLQEREAVIARLEFGFTHVELAAALGKPSPDAARKLCQKAITRLLELMRPCPER